jgi:hypothetical protein
MDCPLSVGLGQTSYRNADSTLSIDLVRVPA